MIYFWRVLFIFGIVNLINIIAVDGGAGMEPVWIAIIGISLVLSFKKPYMWLFSKLYIKILFGLGIAANTLPFLVPTYYLREFFAVIAEAIL